MEMGKKLFFSFQNNNCKKNKILYQKHESFIFALPTTDETELTE